MALRAFAPIAMLVEVSTARIQGVLRIPVQQFDLPPSVLDRTRSLLHNEILTHRVQRDEGGSIPLHPHAQHQGATIQIDVHQSRISRPCHQELQLRRASVPVPIVSRWQSCHMRTPSR